MEALNPATWNEVVSISVPLLGVLLLGNLAFGSHLISKLKKLDDTVTGTFPVYNNRLQAVEATHTKIAEDMKEVGALRERVAVIEYAIRRGGLGV